MKSLITELDAVAGKSAYQSYTLQHGIERLTVLVPLKSAPIFESDFASVDHTKAALMELITRHNGKIKG